jgi:hypothetical protein
MVESMRWVRKIEEGLLAGQNGKGNKEIKIGNDFWAAENWKFDSNIFLLKNSSKYMQVGSCFVHLVV